MESDAGWRVDLMTHRFVVAVKLADTLDGEWVYQPFVVERSGKQSGLLKRTVKSLTRNGPVPTAKKIANRTFRLEFTMLRSPKARHLQTSTRQSLR